MGFSRYACSVLGVHQYDDACYLHALYILDALSPLDAEDKARNRFRDEFPRGYYQDVDVEEGFKIKSVLVEYLG